MITTSATARILQKSIVREFYRRNAGQLLLLFILFFGAVGELEGTAKYTGPLYQFHYQYALIVGLLSSHTLSILVALAWLFYAERCAHFVLSTLKKTDFSFLYLLNQLPPKKNFGLLFRLQLLLFLPILLYSLAILGVAIYKGWIIAGLVVIGYLSLLCLSNALRFHYQWQRPGRSTITWLPRWLPSLPGVLPYWKFFIQFAVKEQKGLFLGIKIFSCGVLLLSIKTLSAEDYDARMLSLLFGIGLFGHGVLIYKFRELEEKTLFFYRGLPVSLPQRLIQYGLLYGVLLLPELITVACLIPKPLHEGDAFRLLFSGYAFLLLLNSLLFQAPIAVPSFLKIILSLFVLLYFSVMSGNLGWLGLFILLVAAGLFIGVYYRYDKEFV
jgi:hypothetical protein